MVSRSCALFFKFLDVVEDRWLYREAESRKVWQSRNTSRSNGLCSWLREKEQLAGLGGRRQLKSFAAVKLARSTKIMRVLGGGRKVGVGVIFYPSLETTRLKIAHFCGAERGLIQLHVRVRLVSRP